MRRVHSLFSLLLLALWLPATLRCQIAEALPEFEFFECGTPCKGPSDTTCADGCAVLESGLFKVSNDEVKAPSPVETLLCACVICLPAEVFAIDIDVPVPRHGDGDGNTRQRTWRFAQRAAPPCRAPAV